MNFHLKRLSYQSIGQLADDFLSQYYPRLSLPIPIEEIAEKKLQMKIFEKPSLKENYDIEGFLTSDLKTIFIDLDIYMKYENRARLTIAHEIGHFFLHGDIFKKLKINSVETLNNLVNQVEDDDYRWLEYQAYSFASQVLVPKRLLFNEIEKRIGKIPKLETPEVLVPIAQDLLDIFKVSGEVIFRRLQKEEIIKSNS